MNSDDLADMLRISRGVARKIMMRMDPERASNGELVVTGDAVEAYLKAHTRPAQYDVMTPTDPVKMLLAMQHRATRDGATGHVYVVEAESLCLAKIGLATNYRDRLRSLRTMSPVPLKLIKTVSWTMALERNLHERFSAQRAHGEWFRIEGRFEEFIRAIRRKAWIH
jgi:hypothetical protein